MSDKYPQGSEYLTLGLVNFFWNDMIAEELLIVMGGLLGSGHCVGMCGGFVVTLGSLQPSWRRNLQRQLIYAAGRISVYTLGGAIAGFAGWQLRRSVHLVNIQAGLSILAGVLLLIQGLFSAGLLRWPHRAGACHGAGAFAGLLQSRGTGVAFTAGIVNGLLPCGLVYAYQALASSTADMLHGAAVMALFGLGTIPVMVLSGVLGGSMLGLNQRRLLLRITALCMIITALLALGRGVGFLNGPVTDADECPLCR